MGKYKAYYGGSDTGDILDGAFFEAKDIIEAYNLARDVYNDKLITVVSVKLLKCYHVHRNGLECNYIWEYSGRRDRSATCPNCFKQVKIEEALIA